jgi:8-oxo-dGTP diphosphatase
VKRTQNISLTVDTLVFGYTRASGISLLLIKRKNPPFKDKWAIPGGFVNDKESLESAAERELLEEAGIKPDYLEQLHTFGKPNRDPRSHIVSVAYLAIVRPTKANKIKAGSDASEAQWFNIKNLPLLAFDHKAIVTLAIERLQSKLSYQPIAFEFLDHKFAFSDLEHLYSTLLEKHIDRRNFKKKIIKTGVLEELDEKAPSTGAGRPGNLFQYNKNAYDRLKADGNAFDV